MTMHCFRRAIQTAGIVVAITPIVGCGGHAATEKTGTKQVFTVPSGAASDEALSSERASAIMAMEDGTPRATHPIPIELHHFNVYKRFHAMLDTSFDTSGDSQNSGSSDAQGNAPGGSGRGFVCSANSLIKQGD